MPDAGEVVLADAGPVAVPGNGNDKPAGGGDTKPADATPAAPPADLAFSVKTSGDRAAMSKFLVAPATAAADKRDWGKAIVLYQALVVARGPGSAEARKLADLWALAGDGEQAVKVLDRYIAAATDAKAVEQAKTARARMAAIEDPFAQRLKLPNLTVDAKKAFDLGRKAFKKKLYGDALVYFRIGYALDPDLPGNLRELGATYDKLGAKDKTIDFYVAYLVRRPIGKNADEIRKELAKEKDLLGTLTLSTTTPCQEIWLNGQPVGGKLPKTIVAAPGEYTALCYAPDYGFVYKLTVPLAKGGKAELAFKWALVVNALEKPYGRISIESSVQPGVMVDLGIDTPARGVVVPADGRSLKLVLTDDSGTRSEERYLKLEAGQRHVIKW